MSRGHDPPALVQIMVLAQPRRFGSLKHMMKLLYRIVLMLALVSVFDSTAQAQGRTATIDLKRVFENYWKTKQTQADLKEREATAMKDLKTFEDDLKKANEEYQKLLTEASDNTLSADERAKRKAAADAKFKDMTDLRQSAVDYKNSATSTLQSFMERRRESLFKEIRTAVETKAKSAAFTLVLDISCEGISKTPAVLFSTGENDITEEILKQVNANAPAALPTAADSTTDKPQDGKK